MLQMQRCWGDSQPEARQHTLDGAVGQQGASGGVPRGLVVGEDGRAPHQVAPSPTPSQQTHVETPCNAHESSQFHDLAMSTPSQATPLSDITVSVTRDECTMEPRVSGSDKVIDVRAQVEGGAGVRRSSRSNKGQTTRYSDFVVGDE